MLLYLCNGTLNSISVNTRRKQSTKSIQPLGGLAWRPGLPEIWPNKRPSWGASKRCCRKYRSRGFDNSQPCSWKALTTNDHRLGSHKATVVIPWQLGCDHVLLQQMMGVASANHFSSRPSSSLVSQSSRSSSVQGCHKMISQVGRRVQCSTIWWTSNPIWFKFRFAFGFGERRVNDRDGAIEGW